MKIAISKKTGKYYYINREGDFHSAEGILYENDLLSGESVIVSNTNREFLIMSANRYDLAQKYKRGPQIILPKDLGYILSRSFIDKNSVILEAGGGSGAATCFFSSFVSQVYTYEVKKENISIIEKNLTLQQCDNVTLTNKALEDDIESFSQDIDLLFLDMPTPEIILNKKIPSLKSGHYIVCYVPSITQIIEIVNSIKDNKEYYLEEISEIGKREWKVWGSVARPHHRKETDHTAFLVFIRKI